MPEIAGWLEKLGMSEYAELFAENKINMPALRYLTDQDFEIVGFCTMLTSTRIIRSKITVLTDDRMRIRANHWATDG